MKKCSTCKESLQILLLLLSCSVTVLCQKSVIGIEGQPITLPCSYKVRQSSDITSMCWGRGSCPKSQCSQELIWTDGHKVTFQSSSRYQLKDRLKQGIVSLTIAQVSLEDAGIYCCRIEHQGWFNDEKINIGLTIVKAPTTTTVRTTTPEPTTIKTTQASSTVKTTPAPTTVQTTSVEVTTEPPPSITKTTSPPPVPPVIRTDIPPSSTATTMTPSPDVVPAGTTEHANLKPRSSEYPAVITENEPQEVDSTSDQTSDVPGVNPDHEMTSVGSEAEDEELTLPSLWPGSFSPDNNENSDFLQGNVTVQPGKDRSTIIIAITLSVIALIVICVILSQLKGQKRGRYLLGLDPHLELVTHAEEPMTEIQTEAKDPNTPEEDKAETNHIGNMS